MDEKKGSKPVNEIKIDFVKWFSELNKNSGNVAGGKGANLSEIYNLKVPVPPGFVITAQAYSYFVKKSGLDKRIKEAKKIGVGKVISSKTYRNISQIVGNLK